MKQRSKAVEATQPNPTPAPARRLGPFELGAILLVALCARLVHIHVASSHDLLDWLFLDSRWYADRAAEIRLGQGSGNAPYVLSPLYPYVLAAFTDASGALDLAAVKFMQAATGALAAALAAWLCNMISGRAAGWIAGLIAALFGPSIHYGALILTPALQALLITAGVALIVLDKPRQRPWIGWLGAGLVLGLGAALHPTSLAVAFGLALGFIARAWIRRAEGVDRAAVIKRLAALVSGIVLTIAPFTARNYVVSGEPLLLSGNAGFNFWIGNHAASDGVFRPVEGYDANADPAGRDIAARALGRKLSWSEASRWWSRRAWSDIASDPLRWLGLLGRKLLLFFHSRELRQVGDGFDWFAERAWTLRFPLDARVVLLLAFAAPFALALQKKRAGELALPLSALAAFAAGVSAFLVSGRYRAPIFPLAIALAAVGAVETWRLLRDRTWTRPRGALLYVCALASIFAASQWLYAGRLSFSATRGAEGRQLGAHLAKQGRHAEAIAAYEASLATNDDPITRMNLAFALRQTGKFDAAIAQCQLAVERDPRQAASWYALGSMLLNDRKDMRGAEAALRRTLELQPAHADARYHLALTLLFLGDKAQAETELEAALEHASPNAAWRAGAHSALEALRAGAQLTPPQPAQDR